MSISRAKRPWRLFVEEISLISTPELHDVKNFSYHKNRVYYLTCEQELSPELSLLFGTFTADPFNETVCYQIGAYYFKCGSYRDSAAWLKKSLQLNNTRNNVRTLLDECMLCINKMKPVPDEVLSACLSSNKALNILFAGDYFYPPLGGGEKSALTIMRALKNAGHNCMAICLGDGKGVCVDGIAVRYIKYTGEIEALIARIRPDLLLTQLTIAELCVATAYRYHIPSIVFIRSFEYVCSSPLELNTCSRNCTQCDSKSGKKIDRNCYKKMLQHADAIISNSEFMRQLTLQMYGIDSDVMYPPVDSEEHSACCTYPVFILMSNPEPHKGGSLFYEICKRLPDYRFMTVGDGGHQSITNCINYSSTDPLLFLSVTKILLVPSMWPEPFGRIALEAMINGIVVIASKRGGLPEVVGDAGILIDDYTNPDAWVDAVKALYKDNCRYSQLSEKAKVRSQQFLFENQLKIAGSIIESVTAINCDASDHRIYNYFSSWYESKPVFPQIFSEGRDRLALVCSMIKSGELFIDIGCADGAHMELLYRKGIKGIGVDVSLSNIQRGISTFPHLTFIHGYAEDLPFADAFFDVALMGDILDYVRDPQCALREAFRVSKTVVGYVKIGETNCNKITPFINAWKLIQLFRKHCSLVTLLNSRGECINDRDAGNLQNEYLFFKLHTIEKFYFQGSDIPKFKFNTTDSLVNWDIARHKGLDPRDILGWYLLGKLAQGERILDMQCGYGELVMFMAYSGRNVYGIDQRSTAIQVVNGHIISQGLKHAAKVMVGQTEVTCFKDGFFDTVFLTKYPGQVKSFRNSIKEALRVVRDGGRVVIEVHDGVVPDHLQIRYFTKKPLYEELCQYTDSVEWHDLTIPGQIVAVFHKNNSIPLERDAYLKCLERYNPTNKKADIDNLKVAGFNVVGPVGDNSEDGEFVRGIIKTVLKCGYCVSVQDTSKHADPDFVNPFRTWKDPLGYEMIYVATLLCVEPEVLDTYINNPPQWYKRKGRYQVMFTRRTLEPHEHALLVKCCNAVVMGSSMSPTNGFDTNAVTHGSAGFSFGDDFALACSILNEITRSALR